MEGGRGHTWAAFEENAREHGMKVLFTFKL